MKSLYEQLSLLAVGIACAAFAWAIFHYLGSDAWPLILGLALFGSTCEYARLRRELAKLKRELESRH